MALPILRRSGSPLTVRRNDDTTVPVTRIDPWNDFEVMNRLVDSMFPTPFSLFARNAHRSPDQSDMSFELYETSDALMAYFYAPGVASDSFDIQASPDSIQVKGERKSLLESTEGLTSHTPWTRQAATSGTWSASYSLPVEIDPNQVQANYKDGVLQIRMAKSEAAKPKQVKVSVTNN